MSDLAFPTVNVTARIKDQQGNPVKGAVVKMRLSTVERFQGYIVPREVSASTDAGGKAILKVWPNRLGTESSEYEVSVSFPRYGVGCSHHSEHIPAIRPIRGYAVVPNADCELDDIMELPPYDLRGAGEIIPEEVAGYASAAGAYADAANMALDAVNGVKQAVEATAASAKVFSVAAKMSADQAGQSEANAQEMVNSVLGTVNDFQTEVVGQVGTTVAGLTVRATEAIMDAKSLALDAIEVRSSDVRTEISTLGAQIKTDTLTVVAEAGRNVLHDIEIAGNEALEDLREIGAQFGEDFENLTEQARQAAKRAGCSAAAASNAAKTACECADRAEKAANDVEKAIIDAAANIMCEDVLDAAVEQATAKAQEYAESAKVSAETAQELANTAASSVQQAAGFASGAAASAESAAASANSAQQSAEKAQQSAEEAGQGVVSAMGYTTDLAAQLVRLTDRVTKTELQLAGGVTLKPGGGALSWQGVSPSPGVLVAPVTTVSPGATAPTGAAIVATLSPYKD